MTVCVQRAYTYTWICLAILIGVISFTFPYVSLADSGIILLFVNSHAYIRRVYISI
jgi:hypothetical protein